MDLWSGVIILLVALAVGVLLTLPFIRETTDRVKKVHVTPNNKTANADQLEQDALAGKISIEQSMPMRSAGNAKSLKRQKTIHSK